METFIIYITFSLFLTYSFRSDYEGWKPVTQLLTIQIAMTTVLEVTMRDGNNISINLHLHCSKYISFRSDYEGWKRKSSLAACSVPASYVLEVTMRDGNYPMLSTSILAAFRVLEVTMRDGNCRRDTNISESWINKF